MSISRPTTVATWSVRPLIVGILLSILSSSPLSAQEHDVVLWVATEISPTPNPEGHGVVIAAWQARDLPNEATFSLMYNTETLVVGYYNHRLGNSDWRFSAQLKGEALFAGVLTTYFQDGVKDASRGFNASYLEAMTSLRYDFASHHTIEFIARGRGWSFAARENTDSAFVLPDVTWVAEPRLSYRFWSVDYESSIADYFRAFTRFTGLTFGIEVGVDARDSYASWGATDAATFDPVDPRNDPEAPIIIVRQWLRAGWSLGDDWRLQLQQSAGYGSSEDDLTRARIGGGTPYVVPIAGMFWASFLSGTYAASELALNASLGGEHEIGLLVDAAAIQDIRRLGADDFGVALGLGALLELRWGDWQLETRVGYAPPMTWHAQSPHLTVTAAMGLQLL